MYYVACESSYEPYCLILSTPYFNKCLWPCCPIINTRICAHHDGHFEYFHAWCSSHAFVYQSMHHNFIEPFMIGDQLTHLCTSKYASSGGPRENVQAKTNTMLLPLWILKEPWLQFMNLDELATNLLFRIWTGYLASKQHLQHTH